MTSYLDVSINILIYKHSFRKGKPHHCTESPIFLSFWFCKVIINTTFLLTKSIHCPNIVTGFYNHDEGNYFPGGKILWKGSILVLKSILRFSVSVYSLTTLHKSKNISCLKPSLVFSLKKTKIHQVIKTLRTKLNSEYRKKRKGGEL